MNKWQPEPPFLPTRRPSGTIRPMPSLSPDTVAQIVVNVAIGVIAIIGSIRGAIRGAEVGAEATRAATQQAIDAERAAARETEQRQRAAVRLLVSQEIDHNLGVLRTLWADVMSEEVPHEVIDSSTPESQRHSIGQYRANQFIHAAMPIWSREAWRGLTALLPLALSHEEIKRTTRFYGRLESFSVLRSQLVVLAAGQPGLRPSYDPEGELYDILHPMTFYLNAPNLWDRIEEIMDELLASGNPISEDAHGAT
jgi:hypothetical protein